MSDISILRRIWRGITLTGVQKKVYKEYVKNGYAERWTAEYLTAHTDELEFIIDLAEVGLVNTEVSELLEAIRNGDTDSYGEECADIIIRVLNFCTRKGIDIEKYVVSKHEKNMKRAHLHGRKI